MCNNGLKLIKLNWHTLMQIKRGRAMLRIKTKRRERSRQSETIKRNITTKGN